MTNIEHADLDGGGQESFDAERTRQQGRRNLVWLVVLAAVVLGLLALSRPLFNNYWDPVESQTVISH